MIYNTPENCQGRLGLPETNRHAEQARPEFKRLLQAANLYICVCMNEYTCIHI